MRQKDYYEAYIDDYDKVVVYLSKQSYEGKSDRFYMKDSQDHFIKLKIHSVEDTQANYTKYILGLNDELTIGEEYSVYHEHARKTVAEYACIVKTDRFDEEFDYAGNDLGYVYARRHTRFALWAPTAFRVILELKRKDGVVGSVRDEADRKRRMAHRRGRGPEWDRVYLSCQSEWQLAGDARSLCRGRYGQQ